MNAPPEGLRWEPSADGLGGRVLPRRRVALFYLFAAIWNGVLPLVAHLPAPVAAIFGVAASVFLYALARSLLGATSLRFERGRFVCARVRLPPKKHFEHPIADIAGFTFVNDDPSKGYRVQLVTLSGAKLELPPLELDGVVVVEKGTNRAVAGTAPLEHARYLAARLGEALEDARHAGGRYRVAPGAVEPEPEPEEEPAARSNDVTARR